MTRATFTFVAVDPSSFVSGGEHLDPIRAAVAGLALEAETRGLTLERHLPDEPLTAEGDGEGLRVAVGNLIDNAIKYTRRGGTVVVSARREAGHIVLEVVLGHGGTGWVESEEGFGKRFMVALPFEPVMPPRSVVADVAKV